MSDQFSTAAECMEALSRVLELVQKLPVGGAQDLANPVGGVAACAGTIRSTPLVDPKDAQGTTHFRRVHGLPPITTTEDS